jgi:hypothetical protein
MKGPPARSGTPAIGTGLWQGPDPVLAEQADADGKQEQGRVKAAGTHTELVATAPYAELAATQLPRQRGHPGGPTRGARFAGTRGSTGWSGAGTSGPADRPAGCRTTWPSRQ